ncbi:uncharacterized protein LOC125513876 isoform X1 [Triticum urartu]|uniref:Uncharacterized protein n=2 Tax=Triticum urartu TaxID=4572 RepID=A0A8R7QU70_TRIUA|nr:uncharacterized protein LOC123127712 isoform X1 [Triticum aestivum]XP_048535043.1 uncharacterized protein LOC125513876 isoform X1 [Triticum urartu]
MASRLPDQLAAVLLHPHPLSRFSTSSTLVDPRLLPSRPLSGSANRPPRFFVLQDPVMEGSSAMSPLGEPSIPMIAACAPALSCVRIAIELIKCPWRLSSLSQQEAPLPGSTNTRQNDRYFRSCTSKMLVGR